MKECPKCGSKYGDNNSNYCIDCGSRLFDLNSSKKPTSNIGKHKKRGQYKTGDYARDLKYMIKTVLQDWIMLTDICLQHKQGKWIFSSNRITGLLVYQKK